MSKNEFPGKNTPPKLKRASILGLKSAAKLDDLHEFA